MCPVLDDERLQRLMSAGSIKNLCTDKEQLLGNHMKALVYAKMFQINEAEIKRPIPASAVQFSQALLMDINKLVDDQITEVIPGLVIVIWTLLGRVLFTYLFQLVEMHTDRAALK